MRFSNIARIQRQTAPKQAIILRGFQHGLNTFVAHSAIAPTEASELVNFQIMPDGKLVNRPPIALYSAATTTNNSAIKAIQDVDIGGTRRILVGDANSELYYKNGAAFTNIGTAKGVVKIIGYNGVAIILDGSFIKYCDGITSIKMAYDAGNGTSGYQFDFTGEDDDTFLALGNGTNVGVCEKFTSQAWETGYTVPPVKVSVYLSQVGTANASAITATLRKASDASVMETMTLVANATDVSTIATEYSATFTGVTNEMAKSTAYFMSIEHTGGDASNYIKVHCNTVASGGLSYYNDGTLTTIGDWNADTTKDCLMSLSPGMPPKGTFGVVRGNRLFVAGDPDNPGYVWYSNLTHLDWSSDDGGGYFGAIDDSSTSFEVGGLAVFYGDLYIYGMEDTPYLSRLTGSDPSVFTQENMFQHIYTRNQLLTSTVNDVWSGSKNGIMALSGVTQYGDIRAATTSMPITDKVDSYLFDLDTTVAGYNPKHGQYWWANSADYHRVLVSNARDPVPSPDGNGLRYPWTEFEFYRHELTSSSFKWTASGSGTNEYYLEDNGGGDPGLDAQADFLSMDDTILTEATAGSLSDHNWDFGDNDSLGYSTVYFRDDSGDPDTTGIVLKEIIVPTAFWWYTSTTTDLSYWMFGTSFGKVYLVQQQGLRQTYDVTSSSYVETKPRFKSAFIEVPTEYANATSFRLLTSVDQDDAYISTSDDVYYDVDVYTDGDYLTALQSYTMTLYDASTYHERLFKHVNFNFSRVMIGLKAQQIFTMPIILEGLILKYRPLSF